MNLLETCEQIRKHAQLPFVPVRTEGDACVGIIASAVVLLIHLPKTEAGGILRALSLLDGIKANILNKLSPAQRTELQRIVQNVNEVNVDNNAMKQLDEYLRLLREAERLFSALWERLVQIASETRMPFRYEHTSDTGQVTVYSLEQDKEHGWSLWEQTTASERVRIVPSNAQSVVRFLRRSREFVGHYILAAYPSNEEKRQRAINDFQFN